jgi:Domain of unknown function DUF29
MSDYETDILLWSERQAELLRRRAAGELVNEAALDWPNIAEEIESVGNEQLHAVTSLLVQALTHMLKAEAWPLSHEVPHWQAEGAGSAVMRPIGSRRPCARGSTSRSSTAGRYRRFPRRSTVSRRCRCQRSAPSAWTSC